MGKIGETLRESVPETEANSGDRNGRAFDVTPEIDVPTHRRRISDMASSSKGTWPFTNRRKTSERTLPKHGHEQDVVFDIMRKSIDMEENNQKSPILSAFTNPTIAGLVFVETNHIDIQDVMLILRRTNFCLANSTEILFVPIQNRIELLSLPSQFISKKGEWIRFNSGKYKDDIAMATDVNVRTLVYDVAFIPRLDLSPAGGHSNRRPERMVFDPEYVRSVRGFSSVEKCNQIWVYKGKFYKNGLQHTELPYDLFLNKPATPTREELDIFIKAGFVDADIYAKTVSRMARETLKRGSRVRVFAGDYTGTLGIIEEMLEYGMVRIAYTTKFGNRSTADVPLIHVNATYAIGDEVQVISGESAGRTGWVTSVEAHIVYLYDKENAQMVSICYQRSRFFYCYYYYFSIYFISRIHPFFIR